MVPSSDALGSGVGWGAEGCLWGCFSVETEMKKEALRHDPIALPSSSSSLFPQHAPLLLLALLSVVLY